MRAVTLVIMLTLATVGGQPASALAQTADAWPQFRGNPSLTGVITSSVPDDPALLWTFDTGDTVDSSAAIADGVVYVGSDGAVYDGRSDDVKLHAVSTGE